MLAIDPPALPSEPGGSIRACDVCALFAGRIECGSNGRPQESLAHLSDLIQEDLSGISRPQDYGQENNEQDSLRRAANRDYRDSPLPARTRSTLFPLLEGISLDRALLAARLRSGQPRRGAAEHRHSGWPDSFWWSGLVFPTALLGFTLNTFQTGSSLDRWRSLLSRTPRVVSPIKPYAGCGGRGAVASKPVAYRSPLHPAPSRGASVM